MEHTQTERLASTSAPLSTPCALSGPFQANKPKPNPRELQMTRTTHTESIRQSWRRKSHIWVLISDHKWREGGNLTRHWAALGDECFTWPGFFHRFGLGVSTQPTHPPPSLIREMSLVLFNRWWNLGVLVLTVLAQITELVSGKAEQCATVGQFHLPACMLNFCQFL